MNPPTTPPAIAPACGLSEDWELLLPLDDVADEDGSSVRDGVEEAVAVPAVVLE